MTKFTLSHDQARNRATIAVKTAPDGYVVDVHEPKRTLSQNDRLWPVLRPIARNFLWHGQYWSELQWKGYFMAQLDMEVLTMPDEFGDLITIGFKSSELKKHEFSLLMELIDAFKGKYGIGDNPQPGLRERKAG